MRDYMNIIWEQEGAVGTIRFNMPKTLNALCPELNADLMDILPRLDKIEKLRAVIITGEGKAFCAGGYLENFLLRARRHRERGGAMPLYSNELVKALLAVELPVIAAINGPAVGGGITLSLACDIRIAAEEARFGAVFTQVGLSPEYGSSFLLTRAIGLTRATEMVLTARIIDAEEALSIGLISQVIKREWLMDKAKELAEKIASLSPVAVRMAKRTLRHGLDSTLDQAIDYEELAETHCFSSLDHEEAVKAFMEKRIPKFKDR